MAGGVPSHRCALWRSIAVACVTLLATFPAWALDSVSLQLKWKHQFQFAGYYAALEQSFYRNAGLDVEIREGGPDTDAAATVAAGKADFGVCTSSVLLGKVSGQELVVLGVIFQHSAAVILVPRRAGISTVSELKGHRLMDSPGSDDLAAMLKREGVDYAGLPRFGLPIARAAIIIDTLHPVHEGALSSGAGKPGRRRPSWSNTVRPARAKRPRTGAAASFSTCSRPADLCSGCVSTPARPLIFSTSPGSATRE
jgi:NMT1/THI5 like